MKARLLGIALAVIVVAADARAAAPPHADPALSSWFESLTNPDTGQSCCAEYDGHVMRDDDWRIQGDGYQIRVAGQWLDVPPQAVLNRVDNPTGGAVAFFPADSDPSKAPVPVYCFIRPVET